ncbi:MAG: hypothetical protein M0005_17415, partial [Actinomycetota bacterium]|nr:hypothetical protein [Actinomycetota bacterium]
MRSWLAVVVGSAARLPNWSVPVSSRAAEGGPKDQAGGRGFGQGARGNKPGRRHLGPGTPVVGAHPQVGGQRAVPCPVQLGEAPRREDE